ncbi:TERF1-interacting nuclear factor 2 isoform X2 [Rhineura floridana]|uniref:TERF1-interacting nuclear factor 2 isoform X2 n=1 Tax=Rhineura floridana TaxID=261503 RepID=UPI002AC84A90|nr:TERF1-interacting nuclear factor 2 isoform X2 [Rhineura floridana]
MAAMVEEEEEEAIVTRAASEPCIALRLVAAAAWHVVRERQVHDFPQVLALLAAVGEAAPDLVHFRHLAKLRLGLQAKVIMNMLQEEQPSGEIYNAIDTYFPETETPPHPKATDQDLKLVQTAQGNFRDLVLGLLRDRGQREKYVQEHLENDYGESFLHVVEELFHDYLWQLENTLPEPHFQQLLDAACTQGPDHAPQPDATILSRYLSVMGYQTVGFPWPAPSPSPSSNLVHSEEAGHSTPEPAQSNPGRNRSACIQEEDSHRHHLGNQEMEEAEDVVLNSSSEGGSSPFKGEYQNTQHNTLIPTFQWHLRDIRSQCADASGRRTSTPM